MAADCNNKSLLLEYNTEPEVFQHMDKFELNNSAIFSLSVKLQFPKYSKTFSSADFNPFIKDHVGTDFVRVCRLSNTNEWQMQLKSGEKREYLIRLGKTKINSKTCWITPLSQSEIRGFIHWIPYAISKKAICDKLEFFGHVLFMEFQKNNIFHDSYSGFRYFAMNLKPGQTMEDVPHFFIVNGFNGLITIKGRAPKCFHCKSSGHRKLECEVFHNKLKEYCLRQPDNVTQIKRPKGIKYRRTADEQFNTGKTVLPIRKKKVTYNEAIAVDNFVESCAMTNLSCVTENINVSGLSEVLEPFENLEVSDSLKCPEIDTQKVPNLSVKPKKRNYPRNK